MRFHLKYRDKSEQQEASEHTENAAKGHRVGVKRKKEPQRTSATYDRR
jgi:hypothetical protein